MEILRKTALVAGSAFLFYQTWHLMENLMSGSVQNFNWFIDFLFAYFINLFTTGVFALVGFGFPTHRLLPKKYYSIKNPKLVAQLYNVMGVAVFRKLLMFFFWGKEKNRRKYFNGTRTGIRNFVYQTKQSEFGHLSALMVIAILSALLAFYGHYPIAVIALVINFFGNLYPILLQRHHRMRLGPSFDVE